MDVLNHKWCKIRLCFLHCHICNSKPAVVQMLAQMLVQMQPLVLVVRHLRQAELELAAQGLKQLEPELIELVQVVLAEP